MLKLFSQTKLSKNKGQVKVPVQSVDGRVLTAHPGKDGAFAPGMDVLVVSPTDIVIKNARTGEVSGTYEKVLSRGVVTFVDKELVRVVTDNLVRPTPQSRKMWCLPQTAVPCTTWKSVFLRCALWDKPSISLKRNGRKQNLNFYIKSV